MSDPYISQIEAFPFNFAPRGWLQCQGQLLPISQNQALFALIGTYYGGDGRTTFALPDLRGRVAVTQGQGPGLSAYAIGERTGQETVTLSEANMPAGPHTHTLNANAATSGLTNTPSGSAVLSSGELLTATSPPSVAAQAIYSTTAPSVAMGSLAPTGGQAHANLMPVLALNYCICVSGIFPTRN